MNALWLPWLKFAICAGLIGYAGSRLSRYGDIIADKTGLGATWVGLVLLATVTSLPELITGVSSVAIAGVPNIAVGDVMGSCVFNLLLIVVLDFLHRGESLYTRASQGHILSAGFGVILIGFAGFSLVLGDGAEAVAIGHVGLYTPIILFLYALAMRTVFQFEQRQRVEYAEKAAERYPDISLRTAVVRYLLASALVVSAGVWLPFIGVELALVMGWNNSFVGTLFVAFATSVPELVVTVSALRIGALDMAIGNLLGSNLFDVAILAVDDIFFIEGPLLSHVSQIHVVSAISAIMMTGVAIVGLFYRAVSRLFRTVGWVSLFLFVIYLVNSYVLFLAGE